MMIISAFTSLFVAIGNLIFLKESPRYFIASGLINEGVEILDYIGEYNNGPNYEKLNCEEVNSLILYQQQAFSIDDKSNYKALFKENMIGITLRLWVIWFAMVFIEFGQYSILPFMLASSTSGFRSYIFAILGETPSIIFSLYFIDKPNFGRKNTLTFCLMLLAFINLLIYFTQFSFFGILIALERFIMKNCYSMLVPLSSELYPTLFRTIGYGWASACGRAAAFIAPFILLKLYYFDAFSPFLAFVVVGIISTYASFTLPYDTSHLYLDQDNLKLLVNEDL